MKKTFLIWTCIILFGAQLNFGQEVEIKEGEPFWYVYMEFGGPFDKMGECIQKFQGEFFNQGLSPAGPFMGIYHNDPQKVKREELKWDFGFQVTNEAEVKPPLKKAEFKHKTTAVYLHIGPYNKIKEVHEKIFKHAETKGYKTLWPIYDKYLNNPNQVKPEEYETQVIVPLEKK